MGLTKKNFYDKKEEIKKPEDIKKELTSIVNYNHLIEFSFDDGFSYDMQIADMLDKYGVKGTFFIVVDWIGKEGFLTWDQVKELDKRGHIIGSHTVSHPQDLKVLYDEYLHMETQNSKDMIETVLGHNISKFCYPRGRYDERVKNFVARSGYIFARATGKIGVIDFSNNLAMPGTIHLFPRKEYKGRSIVEYTKEMIDKVRKEDGYCNIWGHGKEMKENNMFPILEEILKYFVNK